jgi:hypothetical protein
MGGVYSTYEAERRIRLNTGRKISKRETGWKIENWVGEKLSYGYYRNIWPALVWGPTVVCVNVLTKL